MSSRKSERNMESILVKWLGLKDDHEGREAKCFVDGEDVKGNQGFRL